MFEEGDQVRVIDGAFANFTGTVEEVKPDKQKLKRDGLDLRSRHAGRARLRQVEKTAVSLLGSAVS